METQDQQEQHEASGNGSEANDNDLKSKPMPTVSAMKVGSVDMAGNVIKKVLALGNEYVIYEIDAEDISDRLRVFIDGYTDKSEKDLLKRFAKVKQKYVEAKGLLYRSANLGMMKNRVAHTLASCFVSNDIDGNAEFASLIKEIKEEYERVVTYRLLYIVPSAAMCLLTFFFCLYNSGGRSHGTLVWQIACSAIAASLGGALSILINAKKIAFAEFTLKRFPFFAGCERVFLAFVAASIAFAAVKSRLILPSATVGGYWSMVLVLITAGFSESFIPGILQRMNKKYDDGKPN